MYLINFGVEPNYLFIDTIRSHLYEQCRYVHTLANYLHQVEHPEAGLPIAFPGVRIRDLVYIPLSSSGI